MTIKREVIAEGVVLNTTPDNCLCITVHDPDLSRHPRFQVLTPEEVDKLVLSALSMTKPEDLGGYVEEDYRAAVAAVRRWQATRAERESVRQRNAERDLVAREAGFTAPWGGLPAPTRRLVDQLIEARKAGQLIEARKAGHPIEARKAGKQ